MYEDIVELDKVIHERMRLAMMTLLYHHREVSFNYLKEALKTSEGNLATHLKVLEKSGYIKVKKRFVKRRPQTSYELTELGKEAYRRYLSVLKRLLYEN
ncbi:MAG: Helix-turn-helix domain protein [Candidatus Methanolliviera sp. GoM_asphalt]|nr:MAG: Helix-turn-helix domain protein [Candidatus Methanolliviera sp. GoM_asphalt]